MLGTIHIVFAVAALVFGAAIFNRRKGSRRHRILGYGYALSLLLVNLSALFVYRDSAEAGPFHILAAVSLVTLISGFVPALLHWPESMWLELHAYFISWSYVGLVGAGVAQTSAMWLDLPGWLAVGLPSVLIVITGAVLIHTRVPKILVTFPSGSRQAERIRSLG